MYYQYLKVPTNDDAISESLVGDIKQNLDNTAKLKDQWSKVMSSFVRRKWIYRYINDKQKMQLEKHYANLTNDATSYSVYKRSFNAICKFMGIPTEQVVIEDMKFKKNRDDKEQWEIALGYSKGRIEVEIPEGCILLHVSPVADITELRPSFRSKLKGRFMYPNKRVYFTVGKEIASSKSGLENQKRFRYTPKMEIKRAFIDPACTDFASRAVYIETDKDIPVTNAIKKIFGGYKKEE